jgi:hypothetical protein
VAVALGGIPIDAGDNIIEDPHKEDNIEEEFLGVFPAFLRHKDLSKDLSTCM